MKLTAASMQASVVGSQGVAIHMRPTSRAVAHDDGIEDPCAAFVAALEASFPEVDIRELQDVAACLARRITGPELDLTDLTDDEEDVVSLMSPAAWKALQQIAQASVDCGISSVALSPEFSSGGHTLAQGLRQLAVEYLDVSVPADGDTIDFRNPHAQRPQGGFRQLTLNIRPGKPGTTLEHVYVPEGTTITGSWEGSVNVQLHFTDAQGAVLRSTRLFRNPQGGWQQLRAIDLNCIERSNESREAFVDAVRKAVPHYSVELMSDLFGRWLKCICGPVLDLSLCVGDEAQALRAVPPQAWAAFRKDPLAADLTTVIVSYELGLGRPLPTGLHQQFNPNDPRTAFIHAAMPVLPRFPVNGLFDTLLDSIEDSVLNLRHLSKHDMADAILRLPQSAWKEFLRHPQAAHLTLILLSGELSAGGLWVNGLNAQAYSPDRHQSPIPRTAFIAHAEHVPSSRTPDRLFDSLMRRTRGKVLDLRRFDDVEAVRRLPPEAWNAFLRHHRAAVLTTIKASPELYLGGPLVPGLRLRLDLRDPRSAFVAAAEHALPGRPVYKLFDVLLTHIRGDKIDVSDAGSNTENDLRSLPQSAWSAFLRHPDAAELKSVIASDALFAGGPLVDGLQIERRGL
jgi:hypothetical protein